ESNNEPCYRCGQPGHLRRVCPQRITNGSRSNFPGVCERCDKFGSRSNFPGVCERCDKFGHKASDCQSRFKKDGMPLTLYPGLQVAEASVCPQKLSKQHNSDTGD
uniref:CCHC-type domain-containing protein n=1 Tax=Buteo japonicus TaxID=224669 RepID=A0A8B9YVM6_9AVES